MVVAISSSLCLGSTLNTITVISSFVLVTAYTSFVPTAAWLPQQQSRCSKPPFRIATCLSVANDDDDATIPQEIDSRSKLTQGIKRRVRRQILLDNGDVATIASRSVPITPEWNITVWELDQPATIMQNYWEQVEMAEKQEEIKSTRQIRSKRERSQLKAQSSSSTAKPAMITKHESPLDPFGLVVWPGSVIAARELLQQQYTVVQNKTVLILGAGPGVEALAAAALGARQVIATDVHPTTLAMLRYSAANQQKQQEERLIILQQNVIETRMFDFCLTEPLIDCDVMVVADVMYNPTLAEQIGQRCLEAVHRNMTVLVSDSQRLADFVPHLKQQLLLEWDEKKTAAWNHPIEWQERTLSNFSGSGVMVNEDQVYHVKARILWLGLNKS